jgi:hypothetical protein
MIFLLKKRYGSCQDEYQCPTLLAQRMPMTKPVIQFLEQKYKQSAVKTHNTGSIDIAGKTGQNMLLKQIMMKANIGFS